MIIKYSKIYVNNQDNALNFYTKILGFVKKSDVTANGYRWLTVISPEEPECSELVLEANDNPITKTYQEAIFLSNMPAINFEVSDVQSEFKKLKNLGVKFIMDPTEVMPGVTIAIFDDTLGNLIQIQKTK